MEKSSLQVAMNAMKVIDLMNKQIEALEDLIVQILDQEGIISFNLHHELLYHNEYHQKKDPFTDLIDPDSSYQGRAGQIVMINPMDLPPHMRGRPLTAEDIRELSNQNQAPEINPNDFPRPKKSHTYKLNTAITATVLQGILEGYKDVRQRNIEKLEKLGMNINTISQL